MSWDEACTTLREWREGNVRKSEEVVELGERLIRKYSSKLKDELWLVCEQVHIAALDIGRYEVAKMCMDKLFANFPNSSRVKKLHAMMFEAQGYYDKAKDIYEELENEDPTNAAIKKRKIAILKTKNREQAVKQLTIYLQTFAADQDAWMELADLYIEQMEYSKAAFCLEELILSNAFNHIYHQRYAEIKYTQGGEENMKLARQYFAQAVKLSSNCNMRALHGLMLASTKLCKSKDGNNCHYVKWTGKKICHKYKEIWKADGENAARVSTKLAPDTDMPQLVASVNQMLKQISILDTNS